MAIQIKQWISAGKGLLQMLIRKDLKLFKQLMPSESADYQAWRHSFLLSRLSLCMKVALPILLTFFVRDLHHELKHEPGVQAYLWLTVTPLTAMLVLACLVSLNTSFGRRYPTVLFLSLSWSVTVFPQVLPTLWSPLTIDINSLTHTSSLVFMAQATLIPVYWWLHLLSQLGVLVYSIGVDSVLGRTIHKVEPNLIAFLLDLFWFCFICDLAVYVYERLQRREFESRRELQVILHSVSHDLRAPVMGASMVLQNLLQKAEDKITVSRSVLERLHQGSDRQIDPIDSLMEAHSAQVQGIVLHRQPCQLGALVQSVLSDLEPILTKNRVILTNQVSADLPWLNVDSTQLSRVFSNLISNAIKHNPPGIHLTLDASLEAKVIRCSVQDNGVGMSSQQCQRLFELYARGDRARRMPGLGLGLYLCQQIITAHGGKIGVTSSPSIGSTFWFTLPRSN